jgi:hypothetical protein
MNGGIMQIIKILLIMVQTNLCPMHDGMVVYQARALYTLVFDSLKVFDDDHNCGVTYDTGSGERKAQPNHGNMPDVFRLKHQKYWLYPNPNNGNLTIAQSVSDIQLVSAKVFNATGITIYKSELQFSQGKAKLQLNGVVPGLYMILLTDSTGNSFTMKFTIF